VVLVGMIATGVVSAATPVKTSVTIVNANGERFTGRVTSPKKACVKGRKITLYVYIATSGRRNLAGYGGYEAVGKATTNASGNWEVEASEVFLEGDYRASVASKRVSSGGDTFLCMARWGPTKHA
jgi:hypothetical protein